MCYLYKCEQAAVRHVSEKSTEAIHIYDYFKWNEHELTSTLFFVREMYIQSLNYQVFPMKASKLSRQQVWKINVKEILYLWVKEILIVP